MLKKMQIALTGSVVLIVVLILLNVYAFMQITSLEASKNLLAEQAGDHEAELAQKANQILILEGQIDDLTGKYNLLNSTCADLNETYTELQQQYEDIFLQWNLLNSTYNELQQQYVDLLFHYNLLNQPASNFTTISDLEIEIALDHSIYFYQDSVTGNVTVTYLNGTAFSGTFILYIRQLTPTEQMSTTSGFAVDGFTEFYLTPPVFRGGPGNYTIGIGSLYDADGYTIENRWALFPSVPVEAK